MSEEKIINNSKTEVQDMAFLVVTPEKVGVSTSIDNIISAMGESLKNPGAEVIVKSGEKKTLLRLEQKILGMDRIIAMENGILEFPDLPEAELLLNRYEQGERKALPQILRKL